MKIIKLLLILTLITTPSFGALNFDASNDVVNAGTLNDRVMTENGPLTISVWAFRRSSGEGGGTGRIAERGTTGSATVLSGTTGNALRFLVDGVTDLNVQGGVNTLNLNTWEHYCITWTGSVTATTVHFYLNGIETSYATQTNGFTITDNSAETLKIGNNSTGVSTWDGFMSDLAIFNRVLTDGEIRQLANSRVKGMPLQFNTNGSLIGYWPLDDFSSGAGTGTVVDRSGNNFHGTASNGPTGVPEVLSYR